MWTITKDFNLSYGHRVWSQILNPEYSLDNTCACRHLHGHNANIQVTLEGDSLTNGMVTDFKNLNWFKKFLDDVIDHKFIFDKNDPLITLLIPNYQTLPIVLHSVGYAVIDPNFTKTIQQDYIKEFFDGLVFVDFVPTSENLSKWLFDIVDDKMKQLGIKTRSVKFYETPKSCSEYTCKE